MELCGVARLTDSRIPMSCPQNIIRVFGKSFIIASIRSASALTVFSQSQYFSLGKKKENLQTNIEIIVEPVVKCYMGKNGLRLYRLCGDQDRRCVYIYKHCVKIPAVCAMQSNEWGMGGGSGETPSSYSWQYVYEYREISILPSRTSSDYTLFSIYTRIINPRGWRLLH